MTPGKRDEDVEVTRDLTSITSPPQNDYDKKHEKLYVLEAENQMTIWQAARAHKRILAYCKYRIFYRLDQRLFKRVEKQEQG